MEGFIAAVSQLIDSAYAQAGFIAMALEFVARLVKSPKPLSFAHLIAAGFRGVGVLASKVAVFLDRVLPQRLAEPKI